MSHHVLASHDEQHVSDNALFLCHAVRVSSIMSHPMTNRKWVTLLYFFTRQSHQSCLIPWPTESEWHCFISLPGSLINHVSSHDQQNVSDTAFFFSNYFTILWPAIEQVVGLMKLSNNHFHCLSSYPTACERHLIFVCHLSSYHKQIVSVNALICFWQSHLMYIFPW